MRHRTARVALWLALAFAMTGPAQGSAFSFGPPERLMARYALVGNIAVGDVNGDRRADVAVTYRSPAGFTHTVALLVQRTDGTLAPPLEFEVLQGISVTGVSISLADLDEDGIDEIILGGASADLVVARYDGTANLALDRHHGLFDCDYQVVVDIDADGHLDVACHNWQFAARFYFGDGAGGFWSTPMMTPAGAYFAYNAFKGMRLGDVTGDGLPDLLLSDSLINSFFVHENDGRRGFRPARTYTHPESPYDVFSPSIELIDLGGDGVLEVVTASPENGALSMLNVHRLQPTGFLRRTERLQAYDSITATQVYDVDGDGLPELIAGHYDFTALTVTRQGNGKFLSQTRYELPGFMGHSNRIALGDVTGDGCVDLVAATASGVVMLRGCRDFDSSLPRYDYDSDGVSDVLWKMQGFRDFYWSWGEARYSGEDWRLPYVAGRFVVQAQGDFDGDGGTDVFRRNLDSGDNEYVSDAWYRRPMAPLADQAWQAAGAGDFDGDDRADLLWRHGATGDNMVWLSADRSKPLQVAPVRDLGWAVAGIGDFDNDDRSDILWRHATSGRNVIWLGGSRSSQKALPTVAVAWNVAGIGDFDGDRRDDIAWRHGGSGRNTIWLGADPAAQQRVRAVTDLRWFVAAVGDYNGDQKDDLFWRMRETGRNVIWQSADSGSQKQVDTMPEYAEVLR